MVYSLLIKARAWRKGMLAAAMLFAFPALADDTLIEGAKLCTAHLPRYERQYGIPVHLLSAIASTESGRWHEGLKIAVPWPWTINAEGKGYFFASKEEAINAVKRLHSQGIKSIDVGCMQVNLMHHPEAFSSLENAFEPEANVAYAASFLRNLFEELKSWKGAAAAYHSRTPAPGAEYVSHVYDRWYTIIDRVRNARLSAGAPADVQLAQAATEAADHTAPALQPATRVTNVRPTVSHTPSVHVISVRTVSEGAKENGVIMVRPDVRPAELVPAAAPGTLKMASAAPSDTVPPAHVIHISAGGASSDAPKPGPRFIFND